MNLLQKTALYLLLASLLIALLGVFSLNHYIHRRVIHEIDELLLSHLKAVEVKLQNPTNQAFFSDLDDNPHISIAPQKLRVAPVFTDTTDVDLRENELTPVRLLRTTVQTPTQNYWVVLKQPYDEFEEIAGHLSVGVGLCFLGLVAALLLLNFGVSRQLWKPFYGIIAQLQTLQLETTHFKSQSVQEFDSLSQSLNGMIANLRRQFSLQKQFTENASHEMQTPLAVISAHLDTLLQSKNLPQAELLHLQNAADAVRRLSALNKSLLLLTKIENNQFPETQSLNISKLVEKLLDLYEDFAAHQQIRVVRHITPNQLVTMNPHLAEILFSNLLKNAIRHNVTNGKLICTITESEVLIQNIGKPLPFPRAQLFSRFIKNPHHPEATGLGLAIVKQIAERYGLKISYGYNETEGMHQFGVVW